MVRDDVQFKLFQDVSYMGSFALAIVAMDRGQVTHVAEPLTMVPLESSCTMINPTLRMTDENAQALMNTLWNYGMRPSRAGSAADLISAKDAHLVDMREQSKWLSDHIERLVRKLK